MQACGDAHLSNFGLFASPERKLVFDVNDFDETLPAPWEWDVKRLAASLEVAARENNFSAKDRRKILLATASRYRMAMRGFAGLGNLDVWYTQVDIDELRHQFGGLLTARTSARRWTRGLAKARTRDSMQELRKLTRIEDGQPQIVPEPPVIVPLRDLLGRSSSRVTSRRSCAASSASTGARCKPDRRVLLEQYEFTDMARKVVGRGQRRDPLLDHPDARPGRRPTRCSFRSRRRRTRCSVPTPGPASTATRASGWSTGSA